MQIDTIDAAGRVHLVEDIDGHRHRTVLVPGDETAHLPAALAGQIAAAWTAEVRAAWAALRAEAAAPPPPTWDDIRARRGALLAACDWTQLPDSPLTAAQRTAWADYRQALRDLTESTPDPAGVVWPGPPEA